jgi:hypothetical protein
MKNNHNNNSIFRGVFFILLEQSCFGLPTIVVEYDSSVLTCAVTDDWSCKNAQASYYESRITFKDGSFTVTINIPVDIEVDYSSNPNPVGTINYDDDHIILNGITKPWSNNFVNFSNNFGFDSFSKVNGGLIQFGQMFESQWVIQYISNGSVIWYQSALAFYDHLSSNFINKRTNQEPTCTNKIL